MQTPLDAIDDFIRNDPRQAALHLFTENFACAETDSGRSFLGGKPFLPPHLEWPTIDQDGEEAGLLFAGQIDLSDLPDFPSRATLPASGILYFFYKDDWEMGDGDGEGVMPGAVLFSETSSPDWPLREPPERMVGMNDQAATPRFYLAPDDYRRHGNFRFNLKFAPIRSAPEQFDDGLVPLDIPNEAARKKYVTMLAAHPALNGLGEAYIEYTSLEQAWTSALDHDGLERVGELAADSFRASVTPYARAYKDNHALFNASNQTPDMIFCWAVIQTFARGVLASSALSYDGEQAAANDGEAQARAQKWRDASQSQSPLDRPDSATAEAFLADLLWLHKCWLDRSIRYSLQIAVSQLQREAYRHAVDLASEAGRLSIVPAALREALSRQFVHAEDNGDLYGPRHQLLGHGSYDHTAIQPSERADRVMLLKLDCGDQLFRASEGSFHFWITPEALADSDFSDVELTT